MGKKQERINELETTISKLRDTMEDWSARIDQWEAEDRYRQSEAALALDEKVKKARLFLATYEENKRPENLPF
jgi:hypothetical protein